KVRIHTHKIMFKNSTSAAMAWRMAKVPESGLSESKSDFTFSALSENIDKILPGMFDRLKSNEQINVTVQNEMTLKLIALFNMREQWFNRSDIDGCFPFLSEVEHVLHLDLKNIQFNYYVETSNYQSKVFWTISLHYYQPDNERSIINVTQMLAHAIYATKSEMASLSPEMQRFLKWISIEKCSSMIPFGDQLQLLKVAVHSPTNVVQSKEWKVFIELIEKMYFDQTLGSEHLCTFKRRINRGMDEDKLLATTLDKKTAQLWQRLNSDHNCTIDEVHQAIELISPPELRPVLRQLKCIPENEDARDVLRDLLQGLPSDMIDLFCSKCESDSSQMNWRQVLKLIFDYYCKAEFLQKNLCQWCIDTFCEEKTEATDSKKSKTQLALILSQLMCKRNPSLLHSVVKAVLVNDETEKEKEGEEKKENKVTDSFLKISELLAMYLQMLCERPSEKKCEKTDLVKQYLELVANKDEFIARLKSKESPEKYIDEILQKKQPLVAMYLKEVCKINPSPEPENNSESTTKPKISDMDEAWKNTVSRYCHNIVEKLPSKIFEYTMNLLSQCRTLLSTSTMPEDLSKRLDETLCSKATANYSNIKALWEFFCEGGDPRQSFEPVFNGASAHEKNGGRAEEYVDAPRNSRH
ncbi:hypothetical protein RFI_13376, partial [Reticulomyxa filosa]